MVELVGDGVPDVPPLRCLAIIFYGRILPIAVGARFIAPNLSRRVVCTGNRTGRRGRRALRIGGWMLELVGDGVPDVPPLRCLAIIFGGNIWGEL